LLSEFLFEAKLEAVLEPGVPADGCLLGVAIALFSAAEMDGSLGEACLDFIGTGELFAAVDTRKVVVVVDRGVVVSCLRKGVVVAVTAGQVGVDASPVFAFV
jgi:hypothetical protein